MTDGQSFLLFLLFFYLWESLLLSTPGSLLLVPSWGSMRTRRPFLSLFGIHKEVFLKNILPGRPPGYLLADPAREDLRLPAPTTLRQTLELRLQLTRCLRGWSALLAFLFFIAIPSAYLTAWRVPLITGLTLLIFLTLVGLTIVTFRLRHHFPFAAGESRIGECLSNFFFPWHAMRSADKFVVGATRQLHPLCVLLAFDLTERNHVLVARLYRQEFTRQSPEARRTRLERFITLSGLEPAQLLQPPAPHGPTSTCYCRVCHEVYEHQLEACPDCRTRTITSFDAASPPAQ